jgi:hypothetical protein
LDFLSLSFVSFPRTTLTSLACADSFQKAVDLFVQMGRFAIAAKHLETVSDIYEKDIVDLEKAMETRQKVRMYACMFVSMYVRTMHVCMCVRACVFEFGEIK